MITNRGCRSQYLTSVSLIFIKPIIEKYLALLPLSWWRYLYSPGKLKCSPYLYIWIIESTVKTISNCKFEHGIKRVLKKKKFGREKFKPWRKEHWQWTTQGSWLTSYYCFMLIVVVEDIYGNIFSKIKKKHLCVILLTMLDLW